jgi:hypothetical protein
VTSVLKRKRRRRRMLKKKVMMMIMKKEEEAEKGGGLASAIAIAGFSKLGRTNWRKETFLQDGPASRR